MNEKVKIIIFMCFGILMIIAISMQIYHISNEAYHKNMSFEGVVVAKHRSIKVSALFFDRYGRNSITQQNHNFYLTIMDDDSEIIEFKTSCKQFGLIKEGAIVVKYSGERYPEAVEE